MERMAPLGAHDESYLQEAVRTMLTQLCKVGLTYHCELLLEGTIGVTIDKKKVILVHFDEKMVPGNCDSAEAGSRMTTFGGGMPFGAASSTNCPVSIPSSIISPTSTTSAGHARTSDPEQLRLLGAEALSSLHVLFNRPFTAPINKPPSLPDDAKYRSCFSSVEQKELSTLNEQIAINIDSDSESFTGSYFADVNADDMEDKAKILLNVANSAQDNKNIIVIDDSGELFSTGPVAHTVGGMSGPGACVNTDYATSSAVDQAQSELKVRDNLATRTSLDDNGTFTCTVSAEAVERAKPPLSPSGLSTATQGSHASEWHCYICDRILPSSSKLESHLVSTHGVTETNKLGKITHFQCQHCGKKFRFKATWEKHLSTHISDRPHKCVMCRNSYKYRQSLDIHCRVHENSLECNLCNKSYTNKILFQKHIVYMHEMKHSSSTDRKS